jgi:excinuclease ABC subunit C
MELAEALGLETPPVRIECFDISNLQGGYVVGSMAVFEDGLPARKEYRHFRVRSVEGQDDFASLREVIGRRLANAREGTGRFGELPDLMLIDGGRGQLSAALEAVRLSGIEGLAVASVAKKEEEIFLPGNVQPVRLDRRSAALRLVQHVRDEAHRFAVTYHRKLRGKGSLASLLDSVPGIGPARRARLIRHFGSVEEMRRLSVEELARAPGMNRAVAAALYERLHEGEDGEGVHAA